MSTEEVTVLLRAWSQGDREAREAVWPELYGELKIVARSVLRRRGGKEGTTSLVHEAAMRLLNVQVDWNDRHHFYAAAARTMRFVVVDEARRRLSHKRGGEQEELPIQEGDAVDLSPERLDEVLAVHQALERLARVNERQERLVELRYFAGMSVEETAEVLEVSVPTVVRDWKAVRRWMRGALQAA